MKQVRQGPAALTVLAVGLSLVAADLLVARATGAIPLVLLATLPYWAIGAFLLWRQPRVRIGWILLAFGCSWTLTFLGIDYARLAIDQGLPGATFSAWVGEWTWLVALLIIFVVIPVLFPDGQPLTKRWGWVVKAVVVFLLAFIAATTVQQSFDIGIRVRVDNPLALLPYEDAETALLPVAVPFLVLGALSTVVRYRSRRGLERQQLRWFVFSVVLTIVMFVANGVFDPDGIVGELLIVVSLSSPAIAIGIAVMRYRLFDIDKIITRTITYGLVTSLLIGVYAGTVFVISSLVPTAGSLAVAGATLLAAALFAPLRRRAQALVDQRFNRSTYDARITMEQLSNRLRSEVDVYALRSEVGRVVTTTMQPEKLAVWIR